MPEKYDVITIGSGISGLVSSCYLARGGLRVIVIEKQDKPGGYCSSFERQGFRFDVGPHYIGSVKRGILKTILSELDLQKKIRFRQYDPTDTIILPNNIAHIRANPYDTLKDFQSSFPKESKNLSSFFKLLLKDDFMATISKLKKLSYKELLNCYFTDYRLKSTFSVLLGVGVSAAPARVSALAALLFYKQFILDPGYYPEGGMQQIPNALADYLKAKKGDLRLNTKVISILTKNNKAAGVILDDGTKILSNFVISNADATHTFTRLLSNSPTAETIRVKKMRCSSSAIILFLSVDLDLTRHLKDQSCVWLSDTYDINRQFTSSDDLYKKRRLSSYVLAYFPGLHDPTLRDYRNTIQIFTNAPHKTLPFWKANKEYFTDLLYNRIRRIIPALKKNNIITKLSATPYTFLRYTNNRDGALYGWESNTALINSASMPQESSISNLILTGHWCTSGFGNVGGIPGVAGLGRNAARIIYSKMDKEWPWGYFIIK
jgi:phytoene dehydrogenase-like protein